jgi:hypothetical protein
MVDRPNCLRRMPTIGLAGQAKPRCATYGEFAITASSLNHNKAKATILFAKRHADYEERPNNVD